MHVPTATRHTAAATLSTHLLGAGSGRRASRQMMMSAWSCTLNLRTTETAREAKALAGATDGNIRGSARTHGSIVQLRHCATCFSADADYVPVRLKTMPDFAGGFGGVAVCATAGLPSAGARKTNQDLLRLVVTV